MTSVRAIQYRHSSNGTIPLKADTTQVGACPARLEVGVRNGVGTLQRLPHHSIPPLALELEGSHVQQGDTSFIPHDAVGSPFQHGSIRHQIEMAPENQ